MHSLILGLITGLLWGVTNPLIRRGTLKVETKRSSAGNSLGLSPLLHSFVLHITCPAFIFPQLLNLTGSLLFAATLGSGKLSIAVPLANGVSLAGTAVVDHFLGDGVPLWPGLPGVALIIAGVVLCTQSATA